jgi:hypothetical protein
LYIVEEEEDKDLKKKKKELMNLFVILDETNDNYMQEDEFDVILQYIKEVTKDEDGKDHKVADLLKKAYEQLNKDAIDFNDFKSLLNTYKLDAVPISKKVIDSKYKSCWGKATRCLKDNSYYRGKRKNLVESRLIYENDTNLDIKNVFEDFFIN